MAANFWENDPIASPPKSQPLPGATPISTPPAAAGDWWANDPVVADDAPSAQERYDAALEAYRQLVAPQTDSVKFRKAVAEPQPTLIPGINHSGPLAPYDATDLAQHGLFFGFSDEMTSGMDALGAGIGQMFGGKGPGMGDVYSARQELEAARRDLGREHMGAWGTIAEIAGGLGSGGAAVKGASLVGGQAPKLVETLKGLGGAAGSGAAYGFGSTDGGLDQRLPAAAIGAGTGAVVGTAAPFVVRGGQRLLSIPSGVSARSATKSAIGAAPTAAAIRASSKASYKAAEKTGAVVDGNALNLLNHDVRQMLLNEGMLLPSGQLVGGYTKVSGALDALKQFTSNGSLTVKQAQILRKTFDRVAKSNEGGEAAVGAAMVRQLDDFFENLPVQAFSTNGKAGMDAVKHWAKARQDWSRFKRTDTIEKAIRNAGYSRDGFAEGLRGQFASILKSDKKSRGFSDIELAAMDKYARGGSLQDFLQSISGGGAIPAGLLGSVAAGPVAGGAMALGRAGAGKLARGAIDRNARQTADEVRATVATPGGIPRVPPAVPKVIDGTFRRLAVNAANPALDGLRSGLLEMLQGQPTGGVR